MIPPVARLFISVERLEAWAAENRVLVEGSRMTLTELGRAFEIRLRGFWIDPQKM